MLFRDEHRVTAFEQATSAGCNCMDGSSAGSDPNRPVKPAILKEHNKKLPISTTLTPNLILILTKDLILSQTLILTMFIKALIEFFPIVL